MSRVLICCLLFFFACGSQQKWGGGGKEEWKAYDKAMADQHYSHAMRIAKKKNLGRDAVLRAAYADMWHDVKNGVTTLLHSTADEAGLTVQEKRQFADTVYEFLMRSKKCESAAELVYFFDLPGKKMVGALQCEERKKGFVAALSLACFRDAPAFEVAERKRKFLKGIDKYVQEDYWSLSSAVQRCKYDKEELRLLFGMTMRHGFYELGMIVARKADWAELGIDTQAMRRKVFRAAIAGGRLDYARLLLNEGSFKVTHDDVRHFMKESIVQYECAMAATAAYRHGLPKREVEGVFTQKKCFGSDFVGFADAIPSSKELDTRWYFKISLDNDKFRLAWKLADRLGDKTMSTYGMAAHEVVLHKAYAAKAYLVIIKFTYGDAGATVRLRDSILEYALGDEEEWFVATHAYSKIRDVDDPLPKWRAWIERSYLRAMERGEAILAVQIAKSYGLKDRLEARCLLAFEMTMLAEKPKDAKFILGLCGIKNKKLLRRIAVMNYKQKREAEKKKYKRQKKRKKRQESDDWEVKRE